MDENFQAIRQGIAWFRSQILSPDCRETEIELPREWEWWKIVVLVRDQISKRRSKYYVGFGTVFIDFMLESEAKATEIQV